MGFFFERHQDHVDATPTFMHRVNDKRDVNHIASAALTHACSKSGQASGSATGT